MVGEDRPKGVLPARCSGERNRVPRNRRGGRSCGRPYFPGLTAGGSRRSPSARHPSALMGRGDRGRINDPGRSGRGNEKPRPDATYSPLAPHSDRHRRVQRSLSSGSPWRDPGSDPCRCGGNGVASEGSPRLSPAHSRQGGNPEAQSQTLIVSALMPACVGMSGVGV